MFFSNILRSLATIEADVSFHVEAVLRGRLSNMNLYTTSPDSPKESNPPPLHTDDLLTSEAEETEDTDETPDSSNHVNEGQKGHGKKGQQMIDGLKRRLKKAIRYVENNTLFLPLIA